MYLKDTFHLPDEQIIRDVLVKKEKTPFGIIFNRYSKRVRDKCYSMTRSRVASDDLTQDIFIKVMENLHRFRGASSFSTWLYSITYNSCIAFLRENKRMRWGDLEEQLDLPEEADDGDVALVMQMTEDRVTNLLHRLRPEDKAILLMKYRENMPLKKIRLILPSSSMSATKMKLSRAKKRLLALYNHTYPAPVPEHGKVLMPAARRNLPVL